MSVKVLLVEHNLNNIKEIWVINSTTGDEFLAVGEKDYFVNLYFEFSVTDSKMMVEYTGDATNTYFYIDESKLPGFYEEVNTNFVLWNTSSEEEATYAY